MAKKRGEKRERIMAMYDYHCAYCGCNLTKDNSTIDHITPKIKGGTNNYENLVPSCNRCNSRKSDFTIDEYRERLAYKLAEIWTPVAPSTIVFYFEREKNRNWLSKLVQKLYIPITVYKTPKNIIDKYLIILPSNGGKSERV